MHACQVDTSPETGSLVSCTCGYALGPFTDKATAQQVARKHRENHEPPRPRRSNQPPD